MINLFHLAGGIIYYSYITGEFLVKTIKFLFGTLAGIVLKLACLLKIISEDFVFFLNDFTQNVTVIIETIFGGISTVYLTIISVIQTVVLLLSTLYNSVLNGAIAAFLLAGMLCVFLKRLIVLLGAGIWFAVTLIPVSFVYIVTMCVYYLGSLLHEICAIVKLKLQIYSDLLTSFYDFFTDVPMESVAGLLSGVCIVYVIYKFSSMLVLYLQRLILDFAAFTKQKWLDFKLRLVQCRLRRRLTRTENGREDNGDKLCIICEERLKCVLTLPCRHVCMCLKCEKRVRLHNGTCPVCRAHIELSMKVFV